MHSVETVSEISLPASGKYSDPDAGEKNDIHINN